MMDQRQTEELYEQLVIGCAIAQASLRALTRRAKQKNIALDMAELRHKYKEIFEEACLALEKIDGSDIPRARLPRAGNCLTIYCKTLFDRSPSHLAHIVIRGFQTGEQELCDYKQDYINAEDEAKALCARLLQMQQKEKMRFRKYLYS